MKVFQAILANRLSMFILIGLLFVFSGCGGDESPPTEVSTNQAVTPTSEATPQPETPKVSTPEPTSTPTSEETPSKPASNMVTFDIDMSDSYYGEHDTNMTDPPVWTAPSGATIIINLVNHGGESHNWAIVKAGVEVPIPYEDGRTSEILLMEPGMVYAHSQTQWVIRAPEVGEYEIICTVSGHFPFMRGKLIVTQ